MGIVFGIIAAFLLGASDVTAAKTTRFVPAITVTRTALAISAVVVPVLMIFKQSRWIASDVMLASWSGLFLCLALLMLYRAYSIAPMGLVAPTTSVLMALGPLIAGLFFGDSITALAWVGMALGLTGIVLTTYERGSGPMSPEAQRGLVFALLAGSGFGVAFAMMARMDEASGLTPVLIQRFVGMAVLVGIGLVQRDAPQFALHAEQGRTTAVLTGLFAGCAMAAGQLGFAEGPKGPVGVAISQFAAAAVLLAVMFMGERLRTQQLVGLAATGAGVALMAIA